MHKRRYDEIRQDDPRTTREQERMALDRSIQLMERIDTPGATPADSARAIVFTTKLWAVLIEDLMAPDNALPRELKAQIVSIGIWILRELEHIRDNPGRRFDDVIDVSRAIQKGLQ